jgi:hypothetical protein
MRIRGVSDDIQYFLALSLGECEADFLTTSAEEVLGVANCGLFLPIVDPPPLEVFVERDGDYEGKKTIGI